LKHLVADGSRVALINHILENGVRIDFINVNIVVEGRKIGMTIIGVG